MCFLHILRSNHEPLLWWESETASLLSSLAWERNFSVVNSGFFSSKITFQKVVNLASVRTKRKRQNSTSCSICLIYNLPNSLDKWEKTNCWRENLTCLCLQQSQSTQKNWCCHTLCKQSMLGVLCHSLLHRLEEQRREVWGLGQSVTWTPGNRKVCQFEFS